MLPPPPTPTSSVLYNLILLQMLKYKCKSLWDHIWKKEYNFIQICCSTLDTYHKLLTQIYFLDMVGISQREERDSCCVIILRAEFSSTPLPFRPSSKPLTQLDSISGSAKEGNVPLCHLWNAKPGKAGSSQPDRFVWLSNTHAIGSTCFLCEWAAKWLLTTNLVEKIQFLQNFTHFHLSSWVHTSASINFRSLLALFYSTWGKNGL